MASQKRLGKTAGTAVTAFLSNTDESMETAQQDKPQATQTPQKEKAEKKANTKPQKQSFSFRAEQDKIENWKLYAETIGAKDIGTLWTAAIDEYIGNHALTADQQKIFNLKKQAAEMAKGQK